MKATSATIAPLPVPLARDVRHWSSSPRMWRLDATSPARGQGRRALACGTRLEGLEAQAAENPRASVEGVGTDGVGPTFFRLPEGVREEAQAIDPGLLLRAGADAETHRFIQRFAGYLEFLGIRLETKAMRARACIVAPASVSGEVVRPFAAPETREDDTVVLCNLSETRARLVVRFDRLDAPSPTPNEGRDDERGSPDGARSIAGDSMSDAIALALEMGECLVGLRGSILGYLPDEQGEPTLWFECLLRNKSSGARLP